MSIIVWIFVIISAVLSIKEGKGKEKLLALLPVALYLVMDILRALIVIFVVGVKNAVANTPTASAIATVFGILEAAGIVVVSVWAYQFIQKRRILRTMNESP